MTRVYAQTNPIPLAALSALLTSVSKKGWRHEATIQVGVGQMGGGIVAVSGKPKTEIAVVTVLSALVEDPENYELPEIAL